MGNISKADSYRQANTEGKQGGNESNSTAKARAMNELYEELETPECEINISRIAKAKDFTKNNQKKNIAYLDKILGTWKGYFDKLLSGENHRFVSEDGVPNGGLT